MTTRILNSHRSSEGADKSHTTQEKEGRRPVGDWNSRTGDDLPEGRRGKKTCTPAERRGSGKGGEDGDNLRAKLPEYRGKPPGPTWGQGVGTWGIPRGGEVGTERGQGTGPGQKVSGL
jgi:hypothetical protein